MHVRDACSADAEAITAIYNDAVEHSTAIWNERLVDVQDREEWIAQRQSAGYPVLVAVAEDGADDGIGAVLAYASFGDWRPFDGYRHTVEHSVYVRGDQRGNGIGELLMRELIARARELGKHVMVAGIDASNLGSIRLHEKLGFVATGTLREVGTKFGRWLDLTFMQLLLDPAAAPNTTQDVRP